MTATDELRRLLAERGVEPRMAFTRVYKDHADPVNHYTHWFSPIGICAYHEHVTSGGDSSCFFEAYGSGITPEQAIGMTLGSGECRTVPMDCFGNPPYNTSGLNGNSTACGCSECGAPWSTVGMFRGNRFKHNFKACPICGRKVVGA